MPPHLLDHPGEAFKTHANYIRAFRALIPAGVADLDGTFEELRQSFRATELCQGTCQDKEAVFRSLRLAWSTELLLDLTATALSEDELIRIANNWAVVQVYYVFYHATQALVQAKGFPRPESHSKTQKLFKALWADRKIHLPPWSLSRNGRTVTNLPAGILVDDKVHSWANCDSETRWPLALMALRTTRDYEIAEAQSKRRTEIQKERKQEWQANEAARIVGGKKPRKVPSAKRPQLTPVEKATIECKVRGSTLMDYMYRLRIRTNYQDSAMFTDGPTSTGEAESVRRSLCALAASTLLINELAIADILGKTEIHARAHAFLKAAAPSGGSLGLSKRLPSIAAHRQ